MAMGHARDIIGESARTSPFGKVKLPVPGSAVVPSAHDERVARQASYEELGKSLSLYRLNIDQEEEDRLDNERLATQLANLERTSVRGGGRDRVDHPRGLHDDLANAAAGALVLASQGPAYSAKQHWPTI